MKNRLCSTLAVLCMSGAIFGCAEQTNVSVQETESVTGRSDCITPEPLTIESAEWTPHGVFEGTIVISGDGIAEAGYEGILYVDPDGDKIRISCTGAVRSRYGDLFSGGVEGNMERLTERTGEGQAIPRMDLKNNGHQKCMERLEEYEDLEEQGKLLKLPAAIGDEIFFVFMDCPKDYKEEYCRDHEGSCENCHHRVPEVVSRDFRMSDILNMDNIFSTREEAEAALKEL